ncbi:MAG: hypothetical protein WD894_11075 [Pirellulales bacterium]
MAAGSTRSNNLPVDAIEIAIDAQFTDAQVNPRIDPSGNVGAFVSEYMAYHVAWYRDYINAKWPNDPTKQCQRAGHTHVGVQVTVANAEAAVDVQLNELFQVLT